MAIIVNHVVQLDKEKVHAFASRGVFPCGAPGYPVSRLTADLGGGAYDQLVEPR